MIHLTRHTPILLGLAPADFRGGIDGFAARCRRLLGHEPVPGTLHVFINRSATMIRVLVRDGSGFWLATKRLSRGRFRGWPSGADATLSTGSARALRALLESGTWSADDTAAASLSPASAPSVAAADVVARRLMPSGSCPTPSPRPSSGP